MKRIAVLTSGGDSPGMNAAVRAVVRTGIANGMEVMGVRNGYSGLVAGAFVSLGPRSVGGILHQGGTVLGTSRCTDFHSEKTQRQALQHLRDRYIEALVIIGGNGSQAGAHALSLLGMPVVGVASTIDNDLYGTDVSIGATSALDVALENIDRLRVTAASHHRAFLVEVMGRDCGYLALMAGIAGGAEAIVIPETETHPESVAAQICGSYQRGKSHAIIVVAEGAAYDAEALAGYFRQHDERLGFDLRLSKLGHIQRGGAPGVFDRLLATQLGAAAVEQITQNNTGVLVGMQNGKVTATPLTTVVASKKTLDPALLELASVLSR